MTFFLSGVSGGRIGEGMGICVTKFVVSGLKEEASQDSTLACDDDDEEGGVSSFDGLPMGVVCLPFCLEMSR